MSLQESTKVTYNIKEKYQGERYSFQLEVYLNTTSLFSIHAKHLKNNTVSTITNLNWIISEFGQILVNKEEMNNINWESDWYIQNRTLAKKLWQNAKKAFNDIDFIRHLEYQLDEDRNCGEWESRYIF